MRRELPAWACLVLMGWLTVVLWQDRSGGGGGLWQQRGLGVATWCVLLVAAARVSPTVRAQTAVVVVFATIVEYTFSPTLEVYTYRFDNVPAFVPPGHGLVYLSAYALGHAAVVGRHRRLAIALVLGAGALWAAYGVVVAARPDVLGASWYVCLVVFMCFGPSRPVYLGAVVGRHRRLAVALVLGAGALWAAYGVVVAARPDVLGASWYVCLVVFMCFGPSQPVYLGAFVVVGYLEIVGTHLGTWTWATHDPTGWVSIGNPPSGAAGGYGWFDLAGLLAAPHLLRLYGRVTPGRRGRRDRPEPVPAVADVH